ncbi:hypothetical protein D1871_15125 [Nakamurella silvestris]|nr:hypothetical protein D1871_15125 [Nakamurella silvestris]
MIMVAALLLDYRAVCPERDSRHGARSGTGRRQCRRAGGGDPSDLMSHSRTGNPKTGRSLSAGFRCEFATGRAWARLANA